MKENDFGHVVLFVEWVEKGKKAKIIHSTSRRFEDREHVRRVVEDVGDFNEVGQLCYIDKYDMIREYTPYTPFHIFREISPGNGATVFLHLFLK